MFSKNECLDDADWAGYVLHALDPMDEARCEAHLEFCFHCQGLLSEAMEMQDGMALMAPVVEPPRGFAKNLVKKVFSRQLGAARN